MRRVGRPIQSHGSDAMPIARAAAAAPRGTACPGNATCIAVAKRAIATPVRASRWLKWKSTRPAAASMANSSKQNTPSLSPLSPPSSLSLPCA
jgi:hypothetical protein